MDKDLPPPSPAFSAAAFMPYRPGGETPFSAPLPMPYPPALTFALPRPELDRRLALMNPGMRTGAFRPLGGSDVGEASPAFHSAFSPAGGKVKADEAAAGPSTSERADLSPREVVKEERPASLCSSLSDGPVLSDSGDAYDRATGTPDSEGRALRKQRKRVSHDGSSPACPVCGLTLRAGELGAHLMLEIEKLDKLSRGGRKSRDSTPQGRKSLTSPSGSRKGKESPPPEVTSRARYDTFLRIRCNRQSRLSARRGQKKRRPGEDGVRETPCPVCNERLTGTTEELNAHVEQCLKRRNGQEEEEPVDVEGEYEEYEWAGQTRIRATSMLEGGFAASGFQTHKKGSDDDAELNVDEDDSEAYGKPQFTDSDMVPLGSSGDGGGPSGLSSSSSVPPESRFASRTDTVNSEGIPGCSSSSAGYEALDLSTCEDGGPQTSALVSALKLKLRDLEAEKAEKQKCLICMEPYKMPLTSIQCWHVHCENCWMRTLGAKKLCPQCNMITAPGDLRRIYL